MDGEKSKAKKQSKMQNAPRDVMCNILSRLPLKSVIRFGGVSKFWFDMIKDPHFGNLHFSQSKADPMILILLHRIMKESILSINFMNLHGPAVHVSDNSIVHLASSLTWNLVGTCNGLLCFTSGDYQELVMVCNPITREQVMLPKPTAATSKSCSLIFGFGFDSLTKKYKVVRILYPEVVRIMNTDLHVMAAVYTLGAVGSWRAVQYSHYPPYGKPVYANGAVHWRVHPHYSRVDTNGDVMSLFQPVNLVHSDRIISFDLGREEFKLTSHPDFGWDMNLADLGGCLSVVDLSSRTLAEVWVQKDHTSNHWDRKYIIPVHEPRDLDRTFPRLICMHEHNGVLLTWLQDSLVSYEPRTMRRRDLKIEGLPTWLNWEICSGFRGSLAPLGGYRDNGDDSGDVAYFICDTDLYSRPIRSAVISEQMGKCDRMVACFVKNDMLVP